jgi:mono/diheme cytochrome c family protein
VALALTMAGPAAAEAQTDTTEPPIDDPGATEPLDAEAQADADRLREGQQVYSQVCSSCHQPGGAGLPGQFPPLVDNPNVDDAAYVAEVIINGRQGEIVVNGETYNGVMPSFSTLSDEEIEAVTAYIQADFEAPADVAAAEPTGPVAGTELPALTNVGAIVAYLLAAAVAGLVLAPRLLSRNDRLSVPWLDAWLKTAVIVLAVVLLVVVVPDWALKQGAVSKLSRFAQDVIGTGLWALGVALILWGLWYAHRESRV